MYIIHSLSFMLVLLQNTFSAPKYVLINVHGAQQFWYRYSTTAPNPVLILRVRVSARTVWSLDNTGGWLTHPACYNSFVTMARRSVVYV